MNLQNTGSRQAFTHPICRLARFFALVVICCAVVAPVRGAPPEHRSKMRAGSNTPGQVPAELEFDRRNPLQSLAKRNVQRANAEEPAAEVPAAAAAGFQPDQLVSPEGLSSTLNLVALMTVLSLAPSILIMTTCFVRFTIVLGLLRQALGTQQLPPNQVLMALCLFLTFMVMTPVWQQSYNTGIRPYTNPEPGEASPPLTETFQNAVRPIRKFMGDQIDRSGNSETVWMFVDYEKQTAKSLGESFQEPEKYDDLPLATLVSSYLLSELKSAFVIGFQIFLPFLVIDLVVATVLSGMGLMTLPPTLVSFPFKLLLFVLIDGWALVVGRMLASVHAT